VPPKIIKEMFGYPVNPPERNHAQFGAVFLTFVDLAFCEGKKPLVICPKGKKQA
jgi:hypothetical protein